MSTTRPIPRTAKDIMTAEVVSATAEMTLREFARLLDEFEVSGAPVVDAVGRLIGVASKSDLIHRAMDPELGLEPRYVFEMLYPDVDDEESPTSDGAESLVEDPVFVTDFMTEDTVTASPDDPIRMLALRMIDAQVHRLIIVDADNRPVGIITSMDLLKALCDLQ